MSSIHCRPVRNEWLKAVYKHNLIEASERTRNFADKIYLYQSLLKELGEELHSFHPKTLGLREFFLKHGLIQGADIASVQDIKAALDREFGTEVILKPTAVINTAGEEGLYLFSTDAILRNLQNPESSLLVAIKNSTPYYAELIQAVASGEEFLLQQNIASIAGYAVVEKAKHFQEIRIHTYENEVLRGASFSRWADNEIQQSQMFYWAQDFVQDFLNKLPSDFLKGQAWGLDLLVFENKTIRILEINTNRGQKGQWTGFLSRPHLLGAYTRMIEKKKNVRFAGLSGFLLRHNYGNITKHWKKKYFEGIR